MKNDRVKKTLCLDIFYESLRGHIEKHNLDSRMLNLQIIRCNKKNPIFRNVPRCASDNEFEKFTETSNIFLSYTKNQIDFSNTNPHKPAYMKINRTIHEHLEKNEHSYNRDLLPLHNNVYKMENDIFGLSVSRGSYFSIGDFTQRQ